MFEGDDRGDRGGDDHGGRGGDDRGDRGRDDRVRADGVCAETRNATGASDDDRLRERLRAVERALTGDQRTVADLESTAAAADERQRLEERIDDLEARVEELEAATQAVRGYVGSIRAVNREVERRADLALAAATEARTDAADDGDDDRGGSHTPRNPIDDPAVAAALPDDRAEQDLAIDAADVTETEGESPSRSIDTAALDRLREVL